MSVSLGVDVGAVSVKMAAFARGNDIPLLAALSRNTSAFFIPELPRTNGFARHTIALSTYRRLQGNPLKSVEDLLHEFFKFVPESAIGEIRFTGSGGKTIAKSFDAPFVNEFRSLARAMQALYPDVRTVFEMGGENSKYIRMEKGEILDYQSSAECAAGTGSFIDQQASRLLYEVEDVGVAAQGASCAARVAGRCSVFAKSDMIHAQQNGFMSDQILRGLCDATARNFKSSIVKGRKVPAPVAFVGGVALNAGVRDALRQAFKLTNSEFVVPDLHCWMTSLGAGMLASESNEKGNGRGGRSRLIAPSATGIAEEFHITDPLSLRNVILLRRKAAAFEMQQAKINGYLGIDVGSVSTNLVVLDENGNLLKEIYVPTSGRPVEVVTAGLREIAQEFGSRINVCGVGTTGSGRELIGEFAGADCVNDEITAHKTGAMHVCRQLEMPMVDTIFEIGGQDSKFIRIKDGVVIDFAMNEACAAGTGSFLEEQAEKLGVQIRGEFAQLALSSSSPIRLGERCTVFMARDVSSLLLKGASVLDLCAGLAYSVALNYINRVVRGRNLGNVIYFQGGTAYNDAVAAAFASILKDKSIIVPPHNGVIGAIGMALIARDRILSTRGKTRFRGFELDRVQFMSRDFVCKACSNYCEMKEFQIDGEKSYWGDQCSDKFRKRSHTDRTPVIEDLFAYREKLLEEVHDLARQGTKTIGIPRAMFFYDSFPFWGTYFQNLGFNLVVSASTDARIAACGEELAIAQPCFPVQAAHGHVQALLQHGVDYVFFPNIVNAETNFPQVQSKLCPWNQTLPFVLRSVQKMEGALAKKLLSPTVHFRRGRESVQRELRALAKSLGRTGRENDAAVEDAYAAQARFSERLRSAGNAALETLRHSGEPAIVLLGSRTTSTTAWCAATSPANCLRSMGSTLCRSTSCRWKTKMSRTSTTTCTGTRAGRFWQPQRLLAGCRACT